MIPIPIPDRKVMAGGLAGVLAWYVMILAGRNGFLIPADMQPVLAVVIGNIVSYFVPMSQQEILKRLNDQIVKAAQDDPKIPVTKP